MLNALFLSLIAAVLGLFKNSFGREVYWFRSKKKQRRVSPEAEYNMPLVACLT